MTDPMVDLITYVQVNAKTDEALARCDNAWKHYKSVVDTLQWYAAIVERTSCNVCENTISLSQPDAVIAQRILIQDGGRRARNALEGKP